LLLAAAAQVVRNGFAVLGIGARANVMADRRFGFRKDVVNGTKRNSTRRSRTSTKTG
jgi:hypothetical protein